MTDPIPLIVSRKIQASPDRLFAAFKDPVSLVRWFIPGDEVSLDVEQFNFRCEGAYEFTYHMPDGRSASVSGHFTSLREPTELAFSWIWRSPDPLADIPMHVHFRFRPDGDHTEVIITHTGIPSDMACSIQENGWEGTLAMLERFVEGK